MRTTVLSLASVAVALLLACGVGVLGVGESAEAAFPGKNGKIAFESNRHASGEIYTISPSGGTATRITFPTGGNVDAAWSPDGTRIAFSKGGEIAVMNASGMKPDGSGARQLTDSSSVKSDPTWSPDGTQIAFVANSFDVDGQTDLEIWAINADGSGRQQLTDNTFTDTTPAWSPKGDQIAFVSDRRPAPFNDTDRNVYIMNSNGTGQTSITPNSPSGCSPSCYQGNDIDPTWSPDGTKIAYVHGYGTPDNPLAGGGKPNIWTMDPNGANKTNVSNDPDTSALMPAWSPNGARISYAGTEDASNNQNIYVMNANGSGKASIDTNAANDEDPDWQPIPQCTKTVNADNDPLVGTAGDDVLCGNNRNNTINGAGGNDIILGNGGNDRLTGAGGNDTLNGGPGTDTGLYPGSAAVKASLTTGFATGVGSDVLLAVENLTGSSGNDRLTGSSAANTLVGGAGADNLIGLAGNDTLNSRDRVNGNDSLSGGPGSDTKITDATEKSIVGFP